MDGSPQSPPLPRWFFLLFAAVYLYAFPFFDQLRSANEMPRLLMTQELVDRGVFYLDRRLSEFGSTSCKALWRCKSCREPFDYFKCH